MVADNGGEERNSRHFPPKFFFGALAASVPRVRRDDRHTVRLAAAAAPRATLLWWSLEHGIDDDDDADDDDGEAIRLADELDRSSSRDEGGSLANRRILVRARSAVRSELRWLDGDDRRASLLSLRYDLPRPHRYVVPLASFGFYDRAFRRLLAVRRAAWEIQRCWWVLGEGRYRSLPGNSDRLWQAPLWATRTRMEFFLGNLSQYFQTDAIGTACHRLTAAATATIADDGNGNDGLSYEQLREAHVLPTRESVVKRPGRGTRRRSRPLHQERAFSVSK